MSRFFSFCCGESKQTIKVQKKLTTSNQQSNTQKSTPSKSISQDRQSNYVQQKIENNDHLHYSVLKAIMKNMGQKFNYTIQLEDFEILGVLGQGGFGIIYLVQLKEDIKNGVIKTYAMKKVQKSTLQKYGFQESAKLQKQILTYQYPFIVELQMSFQDKFFIYMVMQFGIGGDTHGLIETNTLKYQLFKSRGEDAIKFLAGCVLLGLQYLHKHNIIYRDLKPQNVLLFENGYAKITDFGLSKRFLQENQRIKIVGTEQYIAPQVFQTKKCDTLVDFWAFGALLYVYATSCFPFTVQQLRKDFKKPEYFLGQTEHVFWGYTAASPQLKDLTKKLLTIDPSKRLGANNSWQQVKDHPFFKKFKWNDLENQKMQSPLAQIVKKYPMQAKPINKNVFKRKKSKNQHQQVDIRFENWSYAKKESFKQEH